MTDLQALKFAIDALQSSTDCTFRFCPGRKKEPVDMATCGRCRGLWELDKHMRERRKRR